jgi:hypothetical protein
VAAQLAGMYRREQYANSFGYYTIEFNAPPEPKKRGGGMKKHEVADYLMKNGLTYLSGGNRNDYYGLREHLQGRTPLGYIVKLQPAAFKCIYRWRYQGSYRSEIKETDKFTANYSQLDTEKLDKVIAWVKDSYAKHGLGEKNTTQSSPEDA